MSTSSADRSAVAARKPVRSGPQGGSRTRRRSAAGLQLAVQLATRARDLPTESTLRRWAGASIAGAAVVTVRIVDRPEARRLNRAYRGSDHATNVLSFPYDSPRGAICGDIVLCAPLIRREASDQRKSLKAHFAHLLVHGLLHLQGYHHGESRAARKMETLETEVLKKLGYPDPYRG